MTTAAMLSKVISGGQTGVDQAALFAARRVGIETGGYAPLGFRTAVGAAPWLGETYGLVELPTVSYTARTYRNVQESDATVRIARVWNSPGERCTLKAIVKYCKPYFDVSHAGAEIVEELREWLRENSVSVLNVAGNSESTAPGIGELAEGILFELFMKERGLFELFMKERGE